MRCDVVGIPSRHPLYAVLWCRVADKPAAVVGAGAPSAQPPQPAPAGPLAALQQQQGQPTRRGSNAGGRNMASGTGLHLAAQCCVLRVACRADAAPPPFFAAIPAQPVAVGAKSSTALRMALLHRMQRPVVTYVCLHAPPPPPCPPQLCPPLRLHFRQPVVWHVWACVLVG
jgi:hypothetical protein